jgi:hypothetical protein
MEPHVLPSPSMTRRNLLTSRVALCLLTLAALLLPSRARAAQPTTAEVERLIKRGNELRSSGKDQQALPLYQKAYEVAPTPRTAAQLGLCEMALSYWLAADGHLSEALVGRGDWIDKNRGTIESALSQVRKQIGEVIINGSPAGAVISIAGRQVGTLPMAPLRVAAGQLKIEASAPGYKDRAETVVVVGDSQERVTFNLMREGSAVEPARAAETPPGTMAGGVGRPASPTERGGGASPSKVAGVSAIVGGGLLVIGGGTLLLVDKHETCDAPASGMCVKRNDTRVPGWALVGIGAASILIGSYVVYSSSSGEVAVGASPNSIFVAGRF